MTRRAKIVCTLGPATATVERQHELIEEGWTWPGSTSVTESTRTRRRCVGWCANPLGRLAAASACLGTCRGPKIRLGRFAEGPVTWATGETVVITTDECRGNHDRVSTTYDGLADDVRQAAG